MRSLFSELYGSLVVSTGLGKGQADSVALHFQLRPRSSLNMNPDELLRCNLTMAHGGPQGLTWLRLQTAAVWTGEPGAEFLGSGAFRLQTVSFRSALRITYYDIVSIFTPVHKRRSIFQVRYFSGDEKRPWHAQPLLVGPIRNNGSCTKQGGLFARHTLQTVLCIFLRCAR